MAKGQRNYAYWSPTPSPLTIQFDAEDDGRHIAEIPDLPGCLVYGKSRAEAERSVKVLALRVLAGMIEAGDTD